MPIIIAILLLAVITPQENVKTSATPPVLPNPAVKLVPPPLPAGLAIEPLPVGQTSTEKTVQAEFRDGVVRLKIGDTWLPTVGSCCFCPDGAEKPLKWPTPKPPTEKTEKR